MNDYFYSANNNSFYAAQLKIDYEESANGWPEDAIIISNETYAALLEGRYKGKKIIADYNGNPILSEPVPPTQQELISEAKSNLELLMTAANYAVAPLQDAFDIGDATGEELTLLKAWKTYRVTLNRLDLSTAPDIIWPEIPA
ncbi:tail fiber assembly protein [Rahnella sp. PCH160]|uniref:tail fiber assembly protein n=1 Tax=Rahnella sp. PCH160 TaxID=3447928 RepID=UPI0039FBD785